MARTNALSILADDKGTKDQLAEAYNGLISSVQKSAVSEQIKNKNYSGDPTTGSVEVSRFKNATAADYGTARTAAKGTVLNNNGKVTINVDTDKEIVEEVENKDIKLRGIGNLISDRSNNHAKQVTSTLDRAFFDVAEADAKAVTTTETNVEDVVEAAIQAVETTKNDWVDGVDRDQIVLTLSPKAYGKLRNYIDKVSVPTAGSGEAEIEQFHGVRVFSNFRQTSDVLVMIDGAVAQLVTISEYEAEKVPLSDAYAIELFYSYGTKAVMPDLIRKIATLPVATKTEGGTTTTTTTK